jgi:hypothetical protein
LKGYTAESSSAPVAATFAQIRDLFITLRSGREICGALYPVKLEIV